MKRCVQALVLVAALALSVSPLIAEEPDYKFDLSPMVGWHVFEGNQNLDDGSSLGFSLGVPLTSRWTVEGGFAWVMSEVEQVGVDVEGQRLTIDALYHFMPDKAFRPFLLAGGGAMRLDPDVGGSDTDAMLNYGAGIKFALLRNLDLRGEVRHVMPFDSFYNNLAVQVGLTWSFGKRDKAMVEEAAMMDADGDGVPDDKDACAGTPAGVSVDVQGCPLVLDADGDGVPDDADLCMNTPEGVAVDASGCPMDSDMDGVPDSLDVCADTPAGQPVDELGCPVVMDTDMDGVEDEKDLCPGTPMGAKTDERGCWVIQGLNFDTGKSEIKSEYLPLLKEVMAVLVANPDVRVEIEGYTDSQGKKTANQRISGERAKSVYDYLITNGIDKERLAHKGLGEENPVGDNATEEGRKMNRRVELKPAM